ncbi:hypothetical protein DVH02_27250 [Streptomyces corynorhini]|uniref:Uncharacterized protein n=1 Tax=Streptomyces corynorhini TaxID=2282652 RepID=A0A370AZP3_9ACTN|nr:hypothetical protein DVH02_27250 [Streptomyces corynorhini]
MGLRAAPARPSPTAECDGRGNRAGRSGNVTRPRARRHRCQRRHFDLVVTLGERVAFPASLLDRLPRLRPTPPRLTPARKTARGGVRGPVRVGVVGSEGREAPLSGCAVGALRSGR